MTRRPRVAAAALVLVAFFANAVAEPMAVFEDRIGRLARDVVDTLER